MKHADNLVKGTWRQVIYLRQSLVSSVSQSVYSPLVKEVTGKLVEVQERMVPRHHHF